MIVYVNINTKRDLTKIKPINSFEKINRIDRSKKFINRLLKKNPSLKLWGSINLSKNRRSIKSVFFGNKNRHSIKVKLRNKWITII